MNLKQLISYLTKPKTLESSLADSLLSSARYGDETTVLKIFSNPANNYLINYQDKDKKTALMEASRFGQLKIVDILLKLNPDLKIEDKNGNNALMCALKLDTLHQHTKNIADLLINHSDCNKRNNSGQNALGLLISLYERSKSSIDSVYIEDFLEHDFLFILDKLLAHKIDMTIIPNYATFNSSELGGSHALLWAVQKDEPRALIILLKHGADVHFKGDDNKTALTLAAERNTPLMFELLLSKCKNAQEFDIFQEEIKDVFLEDRLYIIVQRYENKFRNAKTYKII